jgi:anti-sigma-K factor RskA
MTDHARWADAAGSYVLGALTDDEREGYEAHLEACPECRAEVEELRVAAEALPASSPPMVPPPALKARIMAEVEREAALLASTREPVKRRRRRVRLALPALAVAALACAVLVAGALRFGDGARTVPFRSTIQQASAQLEVTDDGATLTASHLPPVPEGKTYMVWVQRDNGDVEPTSALFTPRSDGSATASVPGDMSGVKAVLVNTEPVGGSRVPTSAPVLTAALS